MATIKAYTDTNQSKKLAEFLPIESADMCYRIVAYNSNGTHEYQPYCFSSTLESDIPCWSLAALFNYLREIDFFPEIDADEVMVTMNINYYDEEEARLLAPIHNIKVKAESFIDACVELISKLREQKLL